jgi:hypothetical protein
MKNIYLLIGLILGLLAFSVSVFTPNFSEYNWVAYAVFGWMAWHNQAHFWKQRGTLLMSIFGCTTTPRRNCDDCPVDEPNKIVHIAFVKRGTTISTATLTSAITAIKAAELACNAYVVRNVSGIYDGGTAQKGKGAGKQVSKTLSKKHTITYTDFNMVNNISFYNDFEDQAKNFDLYYFTSNLVWVATNSFVSLEAKTPITDNIETFIEGTVIVEWSNRNTPLPYASTVDNIADCQLLFDGTSMVFSNVSGSAATIVGSEVSVHSGSPLSIKVDTGISLDTAVVYSGTLPAGYTIDTSTTFITIAGTSVSTGIYELVVRGENACGISGAVEVTIIIT